MSIELSDDQQTAFELVMERLLTSTGQVVLTGPAGAGKTTLVRTIIDALHDTHSGGVVLGAPTGKAALRLREVTEHPSDTMHRLLYLGGARADDTGELVFKDPGPPCEPGDVIVIDEASMVGSKLHEEFQKHVPSSSSVLYVGDKEQLEPVKDTWGPDLDNATAELTQVHRQALENPILEYATWIRQGNGSRWTAERYNESDSRVQVYDGLESARDWLLHQRAEKADATLVTFTHDIRRELNNSVRDALGLSKAILSPGDRLVVRANHKFSGLRNGELVTVEWVEFHDDVASVKFMEFRGELLIRLAHIETDSRAHWAWRSEMWERCKQGRGDWGELHRTIHVHYGQCLTVHSSQGSQWDRVGFVWDSAFNVMRRRDSDAARRLLYTAVTRASEELAVVLV